MQGVHLVATETVYDDNVVDTLMGGGDHDWFFSDGKRDKLKDKGAGELLN